MLPISVCLIGKNEAKNISRCLNALIPYFTEIIYTDTGSTDATLSIASQYPVRILKTAWEDDFSRARNFSIGQASNPWILAIDCDEVILSVDEDEILRHLNSPEIIGRIRRENLLKEESETIMQEWISRLYHRDYYQFTGRIHEQLTPVSSRKRYFRNLPISCRHYGYHSGHQDLHAKAMRNIRLLTMDLEEDGCNAYVCFQLGQSYFMIQDYDSALPFYEKAFACGIDPAEEYVSMLVESYGYTLLYLKQFEKALSLEANFDSYGHQADFVFLMGLIYMNLGRFDQAVETFLQATTLKQFRVDGVNGCLAYYNIGIIQECRGRFAEARSAYEACCDYEPARLRLASLP